MKCPFCSSEDTQVVDSRVSEDGDSIRRRRRCLACNKRFTTYETAELRLPQIVKQNGTRSDFDVARIRSGFQRALHKRPVPTEYVDEAVERIEQKVLALGEREIPSRRSGEMVMQELYKLDKVGLHPLRFGVPQLPGRRRFPRRVARKSSPRRRGASRAEHVAAKAATRAEFDPGMTPFRRPRSRRSWRARCELAERGLYTTTPNPRVGCVLVRDGRVIGEGWHERAGEAARRSPRAGRRRRARRRSARRDRLRHARTLQPPGPHASLHRCACSPPASRAWSPRCAIPIRTAAHGAERLRAAGIDVDIGLARGRRRASSISAG